MIDTTKNPWKTLKSEVKYDNPWIKITEHQTVDAADGDGIYGVVHYKNIAIGIIPLDEDYNTWLVGQYRYPLKQYSWEICEGGGLHTKDLLESAKRELLEELGIKAGKWNKIMDIHLSNSVSDEEGVIYIAKELSYFDPEPEDCEVLQIKKIPFNDVYEMVMNGELTDSLTVAGILKTKLLIDKGEI
ncbi:MAG: DNA mismatch repair protein MutT [Flavobacteriales bacterium]|nr:MAG: DNA mismatch repair protein MutT [Flavobacteriales bacterium]